MHLSTALELLNFWQEWQVTDPTDVFAFQKWLDQSGKLQPPVDGIGTSNQGQPHHTAVKAVWRRTDRPKSKRRRLPPSDDDGDDTNSSGEDEGSTDMVSCSKEGIHMCRKTTIPAKCQRFLPSDDERDQASRSKEVGSRDAVSHKKATHSKASMHTHIKPTKAGKKTRHLLTDDETDETTTTAENANANDLSDMELPMLPKPSTSKKSVVQKQSTYLIIWQQQTWVGREMLQAALQDVSEYVDDDGFESLPFTNERSAKSGSSGKHPGPIASRSILKHSSQGIERWNTMKAPNAVNVANGDQDQSQHNLNKGLQETQPWKSPHIQKTPAWPDANVASPPPKNSQKNNIAIRSKVNKRKWWTSHAP
ncbi:hypothetical protein EDC04DRAFT_2600201 [Pisolithus marmoratus]|nr:hypothetical protein EDC04DRAFT_2600201 [Pisolithus marmoratus]